MAAVAATAAIVRREKDFVVNRRLSAAVAATAAIVRRIKLFSTQQKQDKPQSPRLRQS